MGHVSCDGENLGLTLTVQQVQEAYQATSPTTTPSQAYPSEYTEHASE